MGAVEISTNNGVSWITLASYTAASTAWQRVRLDLNPYKTSTQVSVRFRLTTDASGTADGWWIDDISIAESPDRVDLFTPTDVTSDSMRLTWLPSTNALFSHYSIVRGLAPGLGINSQEIARIYDRSVSAFVVTNLAIDTLYYFRIFAVSTYGTYSPSGAEVSARTLNNPVPFIENFEGGLSRWNFTGMWGATTSTAYEGSISLTDSPLGGYANNSDSWAYTAVNLLGSVWPVLEFWDRYSIAQPDWAFVEVSTDGANWARVYGVNGVQNEWLLKRVDLSPWKNSANVRIRFRLWTDGNTTSDGWYVDEVRVVEHSAPPAAGLPFYERFEDGGLTNWLAANWRATTNGALDGGWCAVDTEGMSFGPDTGNYLTLGRGLNLAGTTNPVLTVWMRGQLWWRTRMRAQMSADGGVSWGDVIGYNYDLNWPSWTRVQVSVPAQYRVNGARLRFVTWSEWGYDPLQIGSSTS